MSKFSRSILIENIKKLLTDNKITQEQLGNTIGMSQPNISKALNSEEKKCFTLEQVIEIANYFNVSIDSLVGNTSIELPSEFPIESTSNKNICSFFISLIKKEILKDIDIEPIQTHFEKDEQGNPHDPTFVSKVDPIKYKAFYFSKFDQFDDWTTDDYDNCLEEFFSASNLIEKNDEINNFFSYFFTLYNLYKKKELPEEIFDQAISARLDKLEK